MTDDLVMTALSALPAEVVERCARTYQTEVEIANACAEFEGDDDDPRLIQGDQ